MPVPRRSACVALVPLLALVSACGDEPSAPRRLTTVRFCFQGEQPWVAYRNEGARWTRVTARDRVFEVEATERVAFALAFADRSLPYLIVEHASAAQALAPFQCGTTPPVTPPPGATAVVRPWNGEGQVQVAYGGSSVLHYGADSTFRLPDATAASDLVAVRGSWASVRYAGRIILRRAQSHAPDSRVVLDFAAAEAFDPQPQRLRYSGPLTGVEVTFRTAAGDEVLLDGLTVGRHGDADLPRDTVISVVPESRLLPGDLHRVTVEDFSASDRARQVELWTRAPADLTMRLGPGAATPTFRTLATSPVRRIAADVPLQPDYDSAVSLFLHQSVPASSILITATREYFGGTPATWTLELPDLAVVDGFPRSVSLKPGPFNWSVNVTSRPGFFPSPAPAEGRLFRSAHRAGRQD